MVLKNSDGLAEEDFRFFAARVHLQAGILLDPSKSLMVAARLARRMRRLGIATFGEYRQRIESGTDPAESQALINCLTTNKTDFFRENHHFEWLAELARDRARTALQRGLGFTLRVWSAACATGEEPYSIAITLMETLSERSLAGCEVMASDIDTEVLEQAVRAVYPAERVAELEEKRLRFAFLRGTGKNAGYYQVKPAVRRLVTFRQANLTTVAVGGQPRFDVIFCRNVMIYFDRATQQKVVSNLERALAPGGYLVVGHSESLFGIHDNLQPIGRTIYRRKREAEFVEARP